MFNLKFKIIIGIVIASMIGLIVLQYNKINTLNEKLSISKANEKALIESNNNLEDSKRVLQLTISQLNTINDSIIDKINQVKKELKIKDKEIEYLQYKLSIAKKTDTLRLRDTIFKEPDFNLDTTKQDKWYKLDIHLKYPSTIIVSPEFISESYIIASLKKETIDPPKKCWLARLFQKKHKVLRVEVVEKNPYIKNKNQKFIKIIK